MNALKWIKHYEYNPRPRTTGEMIDAAVDGAPGYYAGELESVRAKLNKMQEVMVTLVNLLPADAQRALVGAHSYSYEEFKE